MFNKKNKTSEPPKLADLDEDLFQIHMNTNTQAPPPPAPRGMQFNTAPKDKVFIPNSMKDQPEEHITSSEVEEVPDMFKELYNTQSSTQSDTQTPEIKTHKGNSLHSGPLFDSRRPEVEQQEPKKETHTSLSSLKEEMEDKKFKSTMQLKEEAEKAKEPETVLSRSKPMSRMARKGKKRDTSHITEHRPKLDSAPIIKAEEHVVPPIEPVKEVETVQEVETVKEVVLPILDSQPVVDSVTAPVFVSESSIESTPDSIQDNLPDSVETTKIIVPLEDFNKEQPIEIRIKDKEADSKSVAYISVNENLSSTNPDGSTKSFTDYKIKEIPVDIRMPDPVIEKEKDIALTSAEVDAIKAVTAYEGVREEEKEPKETPKSVSQSKQEKQEPILTFPKDYPILQEVEFPYDYTFTDALYDNRQAIALFAFSLIGTPIMYYGLKLLEGLI